MTAAPATAAEIRALEAEPRAASLTNDPAAADRLLAPQRGVA